MKYLLNTLTLLAFTGIIFSSCHKTEETNSQLAESIMKDVKYGTDASQSMDIYLPAGRTTTDTKVIVFVHGGSWNAGDKSDFNEAITAIRPQLPDYAIFNINYRLANGGVNLHPAQMNDIQSAVDYVNSKASEYKINSSKVVFIGASAGAHLALLHSYKNNANGSIKAVIDLFGPTNLVTLYNNHPIPAASQPVLINFLGATPVTNLALYQQTSPINFVTPQSPPTLIMHGDADMIVPIDQSYTLQTKLQSNSVKVEMKVYAGEGHSWVGPNLLDTYIRAIAFIKQNVN